MSIVGELWREQNKITLSSHQLFTELDSVRVVRLTTPQNSRLKHKDDFLKNRINTVNDWLLSEVHVGCVVSHPFTKPRLQRRLDHEDYTYGTQPSKKSMEGTHCIWGGHMKLALFCGPRLHFWVFRRFHFSNNAITGIDAGTDIRPRQPNRPVC